VGVAAGLELGKYTAVLAGQRHQGRRAAKHDENRGALSIDRHREIRSEALHRPGSMASGAEVYDLDRAGVGHIDKNLSAGWVDLETLGVGLEPDVVCLAAARPIDGRGGTPALTQQAGP